MGPGSTVADRHIETSIRAAHVATQRVRSAAIAVTSRATSSDATTRTTLATPAGTDAARGD